MIGAFIDCFLQMDKRSQFPYKVYHSILNGASKNNNVEVCPANPSNLKIASTVWEKEYHG